MPLIPYEPFRQLDNIRRELDHFFTHDFSLGTGFAQQFGQLRVDVHETDQEIVATCDIPGLEKKEDVSIDIDHQMLSISGKINKDQTIKEDRMHRQERFVGHFQRAISLPAAVSPENVKATYKNGVLEIRMQKQQGEQKRKIDVQFH